MTTQHDLTEEEPLKLISDEEAERQSQVVFDGVAQALATFEEGIQTGKTR